VLVVGAASRSLGVGRHRVDRPPIGRAERLEAVDQAPERPLGSLQVGNLLFEAGDLRVDVEEGGPQVAGDRLPPLGLLGGFQVDPPEVLALEIAALLIRARTGPGAPSSS